MIDFHSQLEEQFPGKNYIPTVYNSAELQDNLEHSGGITISWNAATDDEIPLGAYVKYPLPAADQTEAEAGTLRYILLDPYAPSKESAIPHYQYQPQFKHPQNMLDRIPFWIKSLDASGSPINLKTTSYTGFPYIIAQKLCDFINSEYVTETGDSFFAATVGNTWTYEIPGTINSSGVVISSNVIITVSFDGCSIKSAANAIADAMGCNVYWDWKAKKIRFVVGSTIQGETYNCFHVLGGTTNMGKTLVSGGFAAVTQRLTLPYDPEHPTAEGSYPGSIISRATSGGIRLTTDLIFDDIYPKQELYIKSARQRLCYLTDENGEFIVDNWEKDGQIVEEGTDGATPVYKTFAKWYVTFKNADGTDYDFDQSLLIQDQPLGLLFQIDYDHPQVMSALIGQQFELTYYPTRQKEHDRNDVSSEFIVEAGEFFIAVKAVGNVILPYTMNSQAKGTVDMAYSTLPPASAEYDGQTAIVSNQNRIYSCILNPEDDEYEWGVLKTISGGDIYIVNHGNLDGTYTSLDTLNGTAIIWNATGNKWNVYGNMLFPCVGDKVTLVNMALSPEQISDAKDELLAAANEIINAMTTPSGEYQETIVLNKSHYNTEGIITSVSVGEETIFERDVEAQDRKHGPVVTQIQQNIDTGIVQVTVGSWTRKTKTGGTVDKLETVSVSSSSPTNGGDSLGDGTFGPGGGYSGGGSSSKEQDTINQTVLKPDSLFLATLGNTIDAVSCDSEGKVRIESDIYSYITGKYGTKDVTAACHVSVPSFPIIDNTDINNPKSVTLFLEESSSAVTEIHKIETAETLYDLSETRRWIRVHIQKDYHMSLVEDSLIQLFTVSHPAFTDRGLSITIQAMREGAEGIGGAFKSRVFCRFNPTAQKLAPSTPTGGDYNHPWPGAETPHTETDGVTWYDGIPAGTAQIWSSVATFTVNGSTPTWSTPQPESDTANIDIEFSPNIDCPADPTGNDPNADNTAARNAQRWYDPLKNASTQGVDWTAMIWRAERKVSNGQYVGGWTKSRIKGEQGAPAGNTATIYLYKRGESVADVWGTPSQASTKRPNRTLYYKFESKTLYYNSDCAAGHEVTSENGWCPQMPSGTGRLFVTAATAYNTNAYDDVASGEWADPVQYNGDDGADGFNTATIFVYKRAASVVNDFPFNGTVYYKFADGKLYTDNTFATEATFNTGWSRDIPATDTDHNPCWVRQAVALSKEAYDAILKTTADNDWSDPAVKLVEDGADGTSPYFADIDNEMDSVACDANGHPITRQSVQTTVSLLKGSAGYKIETLRVSKDTSDGEVYYYDYDGNEDEPDVTTIDDVTVGATRLNNSSSVTITITFEETATFNGKKVFCIKLMDDEDYHYLYMTVNGIMPGADGKSPTIYNLKPSQSQISVGRTDAGGYNPSTASLTCKYTERTGNSAIQEKSINGQIANTYYVYFRKRQRSGGAWQSTYYRYNDYLNIPYNTISLTGFSVATFDAVEFIICTGTQQESTISSSSISSHTVIDKETVPIVSDGMKGTAGDDGNYYVDEFGRASSRELDNSGYPSGLDDTLGPDHDGNNEGWQLTTPEASDTYPYIWKRSRLWDPNEEDWAEDSEWVYICLTGEQGPEGDDAPFEVRDYALGESYTSHSDIQDNQWQSTAPTRTVGHYVWMRIRSFNGGDDPSEATPQNTSYVCLTGDPGQTGGTGHAGRWYDYAGVWGTDVNPQDGVTNTASVGYYVLYYYSGNNKHFYMNTKGDGVANTTTPADSSGTANEGWEQIQDDREYYIVKAIFGDYAQFGSFIINGDWMISTNGSINGVAYNNGALYNGRAAYTYFDEDNPNTNTGSNFIPNFAIDGLTGETYQNLAHVRGEIEATSGSIGGFIIDNTTIKDNHKTNGVSDPNITLYSSGKIKAGDIEITKTQESGYTWSGMQYKSGSTTHFALGARNYNGDFGGHFRLNSNGTNGGVFDVLVAGNATQSTLSMGLSVPINSTERYPIVIQGANNTAASISVQTKASTGDSTTITPSKITTPAIEVTDVKADVFRINPSNIETYESSTHTVDNANLQMVIKINSGDGNLYLNSQPSDGTVLVIRRKDADGTLYIYNRSRTLIGAFSSGCYMCVYKNNDWI